MSEKASITLDGKIVELPVITGTENEKAVDISKLRDQSGYVTLDPGFKNTGSTKSAITFLDGENGILHYRGYPIEQLAEKASFTEVAYLLIYGELPSKEELEKFRTAVKDKMMVHEDMKMFFQGFPSKSHPMGQLSCLVGALSSFYPESLNPNQSEDEENETIINLLGKMPTIVSWIQKKSLGHPVVYPRRDFGYIENFLNMIFGEVNCDRTFDPSVVQAMHKLLILHADHEQNCSTSTVRIVG
jgi:citrate synthase